MPAALRRYFSRSSHLVNSWESHSFVSQVQHGNFVQLVLNACKTQNKKKKVRSGAPKKYISESLKSYFSTPMRENPRRRYSTDRISLNQNDCSSVVPQNYIRKSHFHETPNPTVSISCILNSMALDPWPKGGTSRFPPYRYRCSEKPLNLQSGIPARAPALQGCVAQFTEIPQTHWQLFGPGSPGS
jgi:hypothetical protein